MRTLDGEQADLYVVPVLGSLGGMPGAQGTKRCMQPVQIQLLIAAVRASHPYWDRSGGRDHVFFFSSDQGACGMAEVGKEPIFITPWGLMGASAKMSSFERRAEFTSPAEVHPRHRAWDARLLRQSMRRAHAYCARRPPNA